MMKNNKSTFPTKRAIADLVFAYRHVHGNDEKPLFYRDFAQSCNQALIHTRYETSHQTVKNWEDRVHLPRIQFLIHLATYARDWRAEFAQDAIAILRPNLNQPATYIGKRALERSKKDTGPLKGRYDAYFIP